jgi:hypothetical protein
MYGEGWQWLWLSNVLQRYSEYHFYSVCILFAHFTCTNNLWAPLSSGNLWA